MPGRRRRIAGLDDRHAQAGLGQKQGGEGADRAVSHYSNVELDFGHAVSY